MRIPEILRHRRRVGGIVGRIARCRHRLGGIMVAQVHRFCLDRIVADYGLGHQRRSGNRPRHRTKLCSKRCPADASGTAAESAGAPGVSALTAASGIASGTVAPGVFPPTDGSSRECYGTHDAGGLQGFHCPPLRGTVPKERYTHVPRRPKASPPR